MPSPLPLALRQRVMQMLDEGCSVVHIAASLRISRMSVYRWQRAAEEQGRSIPEPKACGGRRRATGKLTAAQQAVVVQRALSHPKETLEELKEHCVPPTVTVSRSTVWRVLRKAGVRHKKATFFDAKTQTDVGIVYERKAFREAQQTDPVLAADQLIFFDESLVRLNEQQTRGWAQGGSHQARLPCPKGQSMTTAVFLTIGRGGILHYHLHPPTRPFQPVAPRFQACELKEPGQGIDVGLTVAQIQREATADQLRRILQQHHVKLSDIQGRRLSKTDLQATVLQLKRTGRVGLLRAQRGRQDQGGAKRAFRATARDIVQYWMESFVPWAEEHKVPDLSRKTVVWDNAPTHSAVRTTQNQRISVFHRWFRAWGLRGAIFTPPRSPSFNPAELCFAYIKRWIRKWAPDEGYSQEELEAAIHRAIAKVTPTMIENWISGCGYKVQPVSSSGATVPQNQGFRWAGYGPEPVGVDETEPEVGFLRAGVYEPEAIVDERQRGGHREFRLRWKGYEPQSDTWEPESHLLVGAAQLLHVWKQQRHR